MATTPPSPSGPVTPERIMQFAWGYAPPLILQAAIQNRVFDTLADGAKTVQEAAQATGGSERGLRILMNSLVGLGFLSKEGGDENARYGLTPESATFLVSKEPSFIGNFFRHMGQLIPGWLNLPEVVRTGLPAKSVNAQDEGTAFFTEFVEALFPLSYPTAMMLGQHLSEHLQKTPCRVLDLAAGSGVWGIGIAQLAPNVEVTAVDWEGVLPVTERMAARFGLGDRFHVVAGDLLEADFSTGYHIATLGHILHSEGIERSKRLLQKTFDALAPGGTIAIAEYLVDNDRAANVGGLLFAVNMLLHTQQGDTFSFEEISGWLTKAGFVNPRLLPANAPGPLVLADRPA